MGQCCCGRFKELDEPIIINDKMHEPLGPPGNFCGPYISHVVRGQDRLINELQSEVAELREAISDIAPWISASLTDKSCKEYYDACNRIFSLDQKAKQALSRAMGE